MIFTRESVKAFGGAGGWLVGANCGTAHGADRASFAAEQVILGQRARAPGVDGAPEALVALDAALRRALLAGDRAADFQGELLLGNFLQLRREFIASTAAQKNHLKHIVIQFCITLMR